MPISIVLAEDFPLLLRGLRSVLESEPDFTVVGAASDGPTAIRMVEQWKPKVLVLDLVLPGLGGLEVIRVLQKSTPRTRIVVLSMHSTTPFIVQALQNGAIGYVLKGRPEDEVVRAVREAAAGRRFLSPPITEESVQTYLEQSKSGSFDPYEILTKRERQVLQMAAEGKTAPEIAAALSISPRTAESHRGSLMKKLGLQNQTDLVRYAIRRGLLPSEL
ncbi:MAG: response regulator transcription factor [Ignavibacteriota bacterium]